MPTSRIVHLAVPAPLQEQTAATNQTPTLPAPISQTAPAGATGTSLDLPATRALVVLVLAIIVTLVLLPGIGEAQTIACSNSDDGVRQSTLCRIDQPNVTTRSTAYHGVLLNAGDQATIHAGGCVQTGGHGKTWKLYVDPQGPDSDRLYHGLINLPGVTAGANLDRIIGYVGRQFTIPDQVQYAALILGYEDDNYGDNGYWGHDDGTGDQCRGVGDAWVEVAIVHPPHYKAPPDPQALCSDTAQNVTDCTVKDPNVTSPVSQYPSIKFNGGDNVSVSAGGCVQTGGRGKTWKRYVDPQGDNSDRLYHGLISLPGISVGKVERIGTYIGKVSTIPDSIQNVSLVLGYEDDNYGDNGYWRHDDGTGDQCKGVGDAWVKLHIVHHPKPPNAANKPMDLLPVNGFDNSEVPLNPRWRWEIDHQDHPNPVQLCGGLLIANPMGNPPCSDQLTWVNAGDWWKNDVCSLGASGNSLRGHVNWGASTYYGKLHWGDHSGGLFGDDDYNWELTPVRSGG